MLKLKSECYVENLCWKFCAYEAVRSFADLSGLAYTPEFQTLQHSTLCTISSEAMVLDAHMRKSMRT